MDRYVTVKQVGKGSYGAALLVKLKIDPSVLLVIKRVRPENAKERVSAQQEAKTLAQLSHPNVVGYVDSFFHGNFLCIVTEYCEGGDLYNRLKACKTHVPEEQVLDWLVQTARALAHLHGKRIMHRDLKTQNIFLTKDGVVRLGDFGIARALNNATEMASTVVGTPFYMSPELMASKPYDFKTDMWSLGCVLYEMTSLQHAFSADDMSGLVLKILRGAYDPPPACYSQQLRDLVGRLLSKDPDARPDAEQLLADQLLAPRVAAASALFDADSAAHVKKMDDLRLLAAIPPGGRAARPPRRSGVSPPARPSVAGAPAPALAPDAVAELSRIKARIARDRDERRALEANIRQLEGEAARLRSSGGADVSPPRRVSISAAPPPAPPRHPSPPVAAASAAERVAAARKAYAAPGARASQAGPPVGRVSVSAQGPRERSPPHGASGSGGGGIPVAPPPAPAAPTPAAQALLDALAAEREELRLARLELEQRAAAAEAKAEAAEAAVKATVAAAAAASEPKSRSASPPQRVASLERARALAMAEDEGKDAPLEDDEYQVAIAEAADRMGDFCDDVGGPASAPRPRRGSSGDVAFGAAPAAAPRVSASGVGGASRMPRRSSVEAFLERRARASAAGTPDGCGVAPSPPPVSPPAAAADRAGPSLRRDLSARRCSEPGPAPRMPSPPAAARAAVANAAAVLRSAAHPGAGSAALAALRAARKEDEGRDPSPPGGPSPRMSSPSRQPAQLSPPRRSVAGAPAPRVSEAGSGAAELLRLRDMHASITRRLNAMRAVVRDAAPDAPADPDDVIEEDAEAEDEAAAEEEASFGDDSADGEDAEAAEAALQPAGGGAQRPGLGQKLGAATLLRREVFTEGSTPAARAAALRAACEDGLGGDLFVKVYDAVAARAGGAANAADDVAFRAKMRAELGPAREHFLGLVDRLLFEEEQAFS